LSTQRSSSFDASGVSIGTWLVGGGALVLAISMFLTWFSFGSLDESGWKAYASHKLIVVLAVLVLALVVIEILNVAVSLPVAPTLIYLGFGAFAFFVALVRLIDTLFGNQFGASIDPGIGLFLGLIASGAIVAGAWMRMQEQ
jgi:hypothetical protein